MKQRTRRDVYVPLLALALVVIQFSTLRFAPSPTLVRIVLPATIGAVPLALWPLRHRFGVWIMYVGLAANLSVILANGGLMPIQYGTVAEAAGSERAATYRPGAWIPGSKDVLLAPGSGRGLALRDSIVVRLGHGGFVASPGDIVVWSGLAVLAAETSLAWQRRRRPTGARCRDGDEEGGGPRAHLTAARSPDPEPAVARANSTAGVRADTTGVLSPDAHHECLPYAGV